MDVYETIIKRRTIRVFKDKKIPKEKLEKLVKAARMAPSANNLQPLEYLVVDDEMLCEKVFENVTFGGEAGELQTKEKRPVAYILILVNKQIRESRFEHDVGLAAANIVLAAWEEGIGGCIVGAVDREELAKLLKIPSHYFIDLVIALGYSAEKSKAVDAEDVSYKRDEKGVLYVPKRPLSKILHWNEF